jgi:hypothetical protein
MPNHAMPKSANAMYKAALPDPKHYCYMVSMTYQDVNVLELDQGYTTHTDAIGINSATPE